MPAKIASAMAAFAIIAAIIAPPASVQAQAGSEPAEPHIYMNVVSTNWSLRLWGENARLFLGGGHIYVEGRNAAGDQFVTFPSEELVETNGDVRCDESPEDFPCSTWRVRFPAVAAAATTMATDYRFRNDAGQWTDWFTVTENTKLQAATTGPNLYEALRNINITIGRYDPYPEPATAPGTQTDTQGAPTEYITTRLKSLPGGELTAIFLIPMIAAGFALMATRSPAILLFVVSGTMAAAIFLVEASPFVFVLPALLGICGALIGIQFGYTRKFGGN